MQQFNKKLIYLLSLLLVVNTTISCSSDDSSISLPPTFIIENTDAVSFKLGETKEFKTTSENIKNIEVDNLKGWTVNVTEDMIIITAPKQREIDNQYSGLITLKAYPVDQTKQPIITKIEVKVIHTISFEDVDKDYLAGPTSYGLNLYAHYNGTNPSKYMGYTDAATGLVFNMTTTGYGFASGGIAISQWNDKESQGYTNQASVYFGDHNKQNGGNNNSSTFAVAFTSTRDNSGAFMSFENQEEHIIEQAYFTNNTYAVLSMTNGDGFAKKHTYERKDWFKLIVIGIDKEGKETGQVEVILSDFRTSEAPGITKQWVKTDLTPLGKVNKIRFKMAGSDGDAYWLNTPAYFCMDDLTINL